MRQTGGGAASVGAAGRILALRAPLDPAQMALPLALLGLLTAFILYPLIQVLAVAFTADGRLSLVHLRNFFARPLFREALGGSLLGVPLAYFRVNTAVRWGLSAPAPSRERLSSTRFSSGAGSRSGSTRPLRRGSASFHPEQRWRSASIRPTSS